ncbi:MAG: hypothetical protein WAM40_25060 [Xanthobacteraceae bacterium]
MIGNAEMGLKRAAVGGTPDELRAFHIKEQAKWATLPRSIREQQ